MGKLHQLDPITLHKAIPWRKFFILEIFTEAEANEEHDATLPLTLLQWATRAVKSFNPPFEEFWAPFLAEIPTKEVKSYATKARDHVISRVLDLARRQEYLQIF